jgi:hypothetical protein
MHIYGIWEIQHEWLLPRCPINVIPRSRNLFFLLIESVFDSNLIKIGTGSSVAQSDTWCCFNELNRVAFEVLSGAATLVGFIQDTKISKKKEFDVKSVNIEMLPVFGCYMTLNHGYAGRENTKAMYRSCSLVVPDFEHIYKIMLKGGRLVESKSLARKLRSTGKEVEGEMITGFEVCMCVYLCRIVLMYPLS